MARATGVESLVSHAYGAGASRIVKLGTLTNSAATTVAVNVSGWPIKRLYNESGGSLTFTFMDALSKEGTAMDVWDDDNGACPTLTLADDDCALLPYALTGVTWLILVLSASTATGVTLKLER